MSLRFAFALLCLWVPAPAQDVAAKVDEYIQAHMKMGQFNGSVLVARDGQKLVSKGYGMANLEYDVPNTPRTKFRLGSITKQFTAMAIAQLAERGKLSLDDSARKYVPDAQEEWDKVTVRHLLTHTSGIPSFTSFTDYSTFKLLPTNPAELMARFKHKPLEFEPGEKFRYNNSGYYLLGFIVEKASGLSYEAYLKENIFGPLEMNDSGYDSNRAIVKGRAAGYARRDGKWVNADHINMEIPGGAGGLYSTVEDLYRWDQALYTDKLVSKPMVEAIFTPDKEDYAFGWVVKKQFNRRRTAHGGGIEGFNTIIARYPDDRVCVIALSNLNSGELDRIGNDLAAIVFGEKYEAPRERTAVRVDPKLFDAYAGKYELQPEFIITIRRDGDKLMAQPTGQSELEIFAESETKFFVKVVDAQITFVKDEEGRVTGLILHQGGRDQPAKKIE
ncbi:MAG: serine hydrolase [Bryobacteraceae bacterium]|nr:serine hydrolase [Bryobacteraceae bacterium]